jgi:hypothetical protein
LRHLLTERVNSSARGTPMPQAVRRYAAGRYRAETEMMARLVEGGTREWLAEIDRILA